MSGMKRILQALRLDKIAAVDKPCQEPAQAVIMKRREDAESVWKAKYDAKARDEMAANGEAMSDGSYPIKDAADLDHAVHAIGRGKNNSHTAIRTHIKARAKVLGLSDKLPEAWADGERMAKALNAALVKAGVMLAGTDDDEGAQDFDQTLGEQTLTQAFWDAYYKGTSALQDSLTSILKDDDVADKAPLITEALQQFADYIEGIVPGDLGKSLAAGIVAKSAGRAGVKAGAPAMDAIKKALGLDASATEADVAKAIEALNKANALQEAIAKMSDKHKAYAAHADAKMPGGGKEAFAAMSSAERDDHMKANPVGEPDGDEVAKALASGDAFKTPAGVVITKRQVGEALFSVLKGQNDQLVSQGVELAKTREDTAVADFAKRAVGLGFEEGFGATMRKAYGGDATAQAEVEKRMKALQSQAEAGGIFKTFGHNNPAEGTAAAELVAKVAEIRKADPKLSEHQARATAYETTPGLMKRIRDESAEAA